MIKTEEYMIESDCFDSPYNIIGIDFDGITANTTEIAAKILAKKYPDYFSELKPWETDVYSFKKLLETQNIPKNIKEIVAEIPDIYGRECLKRVKPVTGFIEAVRILSKDYGLVTVSARNETDAGYAQEWMNNNGASKYFLGWCAQYDINGKQAPKSQLCNKIEPTAIIEDDLGHLAEILRYKNYEGPLMALHLKHGVPPDKLSQYEKYEKYGVHTSNSWQDVVNHIYDTDKPYSERLDPTNYIVA